jgi:hypothetical protein
MGEATDRWAALRKAFGAFPGEPYEDNIYNAARDLLAERDELAAQLAATCREAANWLKSDIEPNPGHVTAALSHAQWLSEQLEEQSRRIAELESRK